MPKCSTADPGLSELRRQAAAELREDILPLWERRAFDADGWLVGAVLDDLSVDNEVPRHSVIVARVLWTFAAVARAEAEQKLLPNLLPMGRWARRVV